MFPLPCEVLGARGPETVFKHFAGHLLGGAFDAIVGAAMVGVGFLATYIGFKMQGNEKIIGMVGYGNIKGADIDGGFYAGKGVGNVTLGVVGNFLTDNLARVWGNTKDEPPAFGVEEGAGGVHAVLEFTGGFLEF